MSSAYDPGLVCVYEHSDEFQALCNRLTIISCVVSSVSLLARACDQGTPGGFHANFATQCVFISVLLSFDLLISTVYNFKQMTSQSLFFTHICLFQGIIFQFFAVIFHMQ